MRFNCWGSNLINTQGHIQKLECCFPIRAMYQMEGKGLNIDDFLHWVTDFFSEKQLQFLNPYPCVRCILPLGFFFFLKSEE